MLLIAGSGETKAVNGDLARTSPRPIGKGSGRPCLAPGVGETPVTQIDGRGDRTIGARVAKAD
jgi:hypothetical protein